MMPEHDQFVTRKELSEVTDSINSKLDRLADKLDGKTQPNWAVIWSALGVGAVLVIAVAGGSWALLNTQISGIREGVQSFESRLQRTENVLDRDRDAKAKIADTLLLDVLRER